MADANSPCQGTAMVRITIDIDLPDGVTVTGYHRHLQGHSFEVSWPWPQHVRCPCCRHQDLAYLEQNVRRCWQSNRAGTRRSRASAWNA